MRIGARVSILVFLGIGLAACGTSADAGSSAHGPHGAHATPSGSRPPISPPPPAQTGTFVPGGGASAGGFSSGGGFTSTGGFGGGGYGGGGGGGGGMHFTHLSGFAADAARREQSRQARLYRAHHPGPQRMTGETTAEQRHREMVTAARGAVPQYDIDDDACERSWAQQVAFQRSLHATRDDGLMHSDAQLARDESQFLDMCHAREPEDQQCMDQTYVTTHRDECAQRQAAVRAEGEPRVRAMDHLGD